MEEQIKNLNVNITESMMLIALFCSFAVQFVKAALKRFNFFTDDEVKKSFFPMISIFFTAGALFLVGTKDWLMAGVILGWSACGGYDSFSGSAGLVKKANNGNTVASTTVVLLLCFLLLTSGCISSQPNPRADLVASQKIFAATVDSLTALQQAGTFSAEETEQIGIFINLGGGLLDQWEIAVKSGITSPDIIESFQEVLNKLIEYQVKKGGGV
jgi:hypothetical protein